jgi:hypothetical protein
MVIFVLFLKMHCFGVFPVVSFMYGVFIYHTIFDLFPFCSPHLVHQQT